MNNIIDHMNNNIELIYNKNKIKNLTTLKK